MSNLINAVKEIQSRQDSYNEAMDYHEGEVDEYFASPQIRRLLKDTSGNFKLNFAKVPVSAVLDRLEITSIASEDSEADETIQSIMRHNEFDIESDDVHKKGLIYGDSYVMVWPDDEDKVEITYNSPLTTAIFYDPEFPRRKAFAAKVWDVSVGGKTKIRVNLYYDTHVEKYISKTEKVKTDRDFEIYVDESTDDEGMVLNPYGEIPIFHFRTQRPYGRPEHKDAFGPQDAINKLVITQMAANDFQGFPQRYVLAGHGESSEDLTDFGDDFGDDVDTSDSELRSGPGELWWLTGDNLDVGEFSTADVNAFLEPLREYVKAMANTTETPLHYFEKDGSAPSGESLRVAEAPLVKKIENRQKLFGATWRKIFRFALKIAGIETTDISVDWAPASSHDDKDAWEVAILKLEAGVPLPIVLRELGYDNETIAEIVDNVDDPEDVEAIAEQTAETLE